MIITATEMYQATLRIVNKSHTISIEPAEWESLVRLAQLNIVKRKYELFQFTQKRIDDLRILISDPAIDPVLAGPISNYEFPLPILVGDQPHYFLMLNCAFRIKYLNNDCGIPDDTISAFLMARIMRDDMELKIAEDPYNKPKDSRLYYKLVGDKAILYTGSQSTGVQAKYSYLKYPPDIKLIPSDVDCILPFHVRHEIVEETARVIIELIESGRYRTFINEQLNSAA